MEKVIKVVSDALSPYPKGGDAEYSHEKFEASGCVVVY